MSSWIIENQTVVGRQVVWFMFDTCGACFDRVKHAEETKFVT